MRQAKHLSTQRAALRCAAVLGTLLLAGSLGVSGASAASTAPVEESGPGLSVLIAEGTIAVSASPPTDSEATTGPEMETPAAIPGPSVTDEASETPSTPSSPSEPAPSTEPSDPSGTGDPTAPTEDPSDSSSPTTDPMPTPTEPSEPTPAPSTEPTRQPTETSSPSSPPQHETPIVRPPGGGTSSPSSGEGSPGLSSAAGGTQYSNNRPQAVQQGGERDARTGFQVDAASGFPVHPQTGLLIDPSTGRMLTRGSLEPSDFVYDFVSGQIQLATPDKSEDASGAEPSAVSSGGSTSSNDDTEAPVGYNGDGPQARQADTSPTASIGMSPPTMAVVLGSLIVVGGLWYFFVFVRRPGTKPQHRD